MTFMRGVIRLTRIRMFGLRSEAGRTNCVSGTMKAVIAFLVLFSLALPVRATAANPDLDTVLTGSRQRIQKLDYRVTGRLTRVEANGKRTTYKFAAKAHWFPDGLRMLFDISGPNSEKTILLLHMSPNGHLSIETALPGEQTVSALPVDHWSDPLLGTDFSYEDMAEAQFFWKNQELQTPEKYGARDCFVLKSTPGPQEHTAYASVTSWIDRSIVYPVHIVKTLRGTGQQKEFISFGLRKVSGAWSASQIEAKQQGKPGSSMLVIEGGTGKANLALKDFEIRPAGAQAKK